MPTCRDTAAACRRDIAQSLGLEPNPRSPGDWEGPCPECGHGGFALSAPTRSRSLRHIWVCNCQHCQCRDRAGAAIVRVAMLRRGVDRGCLGDYDGTVQRQPDSALVLAARDILATPHLKPADIRVILAEASGQKVPGTRRAFVLWATNIGISERQAYEAAKRWCS